MIKLPAGAFLLIASVALAGEATLPFECPTPPGWSAATTEDSVLRMTGPADDNGVQSLILVRYYAPGDKIFPNAEAYIARQTEAPLFDLPGDKRGSATAATVAGRKARRVVDESSISVPPNSLGSKKVAMRREHVVVPAERGFFVLLNDAPRVLAAKNRAAFSAVLAGFRPKR
jgi:hypothetical protein